MLDTGSLRVGELIIQGSRFLGQSGVTDCELEARLFMAHLLGCRPAELFLRREESLEPARAGLFMEMLTRRAGREPLQYITGEQEFMGHTFRVGPEVLIPRPETELLVEEVLKRAPSTGPVLIVDLCTGSGCIAVSIAKELKGARIIATDISEAAVCTARSNAVNLGVEERVEFLRGDLFSALDGTGVKGRIDIIVSNPPYVAKEDFLMLEPEVRNFEPKEALLAGSDGLRFLRAVIEGAPEWLRPGGELLVEIGFGQRDAVTGIFEGTGRYMDVWTRKDYSGIHRIAGARLKGGEV